MFPKSLFLCCSLASFIFLSVSCQSLQLDVARYACVTKTGKMLDKECTYRLNQKNWKPKLIPFAKARKRIETLCSQLTEQFLVIRNYAKITNGLFARIIEKISALTILQYVNFINNKPIGRIKYALN